MTTTLAKLYKNGYESGVMSHFPFSQDYFTHFLVLATIAGAAHMIAPDHWMPLSLMGWQKRWGGVRISMTSALLFSMHLGAGYLIYLLITPLFQICDPQLLFQTSVILVLLSFVFRFSRLDKIDDVLLQNVRRRHSYMELWGADTVVGFLGPCETLVPILIKAHAHPELVLPAWGAFTAGTLVAGLLLIAFTRRLWDEPMRVTRSLFWANQAGNWVPGFMWVGLGVSVVFMIRK